MFFRFLLTLLLGIQPLFLISQIFEKGFEVRGKTVMKDTQLPLGGVIVINQNTEKQTQSNVDGIFSISASPGDILVFLSQFVKRKKVKLPYELNFPVFLQVELEEEIQLLDEVTIYPKLSGILQYDLKSVPENPLNELEKALGIPINKGPGQKKNEPVFPSILSMNVDALYDILSGNRRRREAYNKLMTRQKTIEVIVSYVKKDFLTEELKIPENEIPVFMDFVAASEDLETLLREHNYVRIVKVMSDLSIVYLLRREKATYWRDQK